jgi:outer membrane immunogenic protein
MKKFAVAASIVVASTIGASAADLASRPYTKAPVSAVQNWGGLYVGGNAGYAWGDADTVGTMVAPAPFLAIDAAAVNAASSPRLKPDGFSGGLQAGYNWQDGAAVFGLEADFDAFRLRGNAAGTFAFPSTLPGGPVGPPTQFFTSASSVSTDWLFTGRGRLGWANDHWLLYATGGVAVTNARVNQTVGLLAPFVIGASTSSTRVGWTVGAGVEYAINTNWSFKAEYLYLDFGNIGGVGNVTPAFAGLTYGNSTRLTANLARVGVNYRFGGPVVAKY